MAFSNLSSVFQRQPSSRRADERATDRDDRIESKSDSRLVPEQALQGNYQRLSRGLFWKSY